MSKWNISMGNLAMMQGIIDYTSVTREGMVVDYNWSNNGLFYNHGGVLPKGVCVLTFKVEDGPSDNTS
jgi:hypothetical protein